MKKMTLAAKIGIALLGGFMAGYYLRPLVEKMPEVQMEINISPKTPTLPLNPDSKKPLEYEFYFYKEEEPIYKTPPDDKRRLEGIIV